MSRDRVLTLVTRGMRYEEAAVALGIPPGLAYLLATGLAADAGDGLAPEDTRRPGFSPASTQHLVHPLARAPEPSRADGALDAWMAARVRADAAMAAARRSIPGTGPTGTDIVAVLVSGHNEIAHLLEALGGAPVADRSRVLERLFDTLLRHDTAEERLLWPAVADTLDAGPSIASMARRQERDAARLLRDLRRTDPADERFPQLVARLALVVRKHVALEDEVFARLRQRVPADALDSLGARMRRALAPTSVPEDRS